MSFSNGAQRAPRQSPSTRLAGIIVLVALLGVGSALTGPAPVAASAAPKVAIIVGPAGAQTGVNKDWANAAAREALRYTANVVKVYSPYATWARVKAAITGASIVVYIGRGRGFPSPYGSTLRPYMEDGFGLNAVSGGGNWTTRYYGEAYIRTARLAPKAAVLLSHLSYASGNSEPGRPQPTLAVARRRVDNYGAGFLAAGASVVISEAVYPPTYYIRAIFTRNASVDSVWRTAPTYHGHVTSFASTRRLGAIGRTDPVTRTWGYYRSIVGWPGTSTAVIRRAAVQVPPAAPAPALAQQTIAVPASIDATGATNASAALTTWLGTVPDGSTIVFRAGGVYRMDRGLQFTNRHNLVFEGNGATLKSSGDASSQSSLFTVYRDSSITIRNFVLVGNSPTPGVYSTLGEQAMAVSVRGSTNVDISNVTISAVWGDGLYVADWSDTVWFHDSRVVSSGLMGVAITSGRNVTVERVAFDKVGYGVFDIEPNYSTEGASNVKFLNNTVGTISQVRGKAFLFGANGAAGSVVSGVTVSGNTVTGDSLDTYVNDTTRRQNIVFTNNRSTVAASGPVLYLAHIDGLTVTGNVQPLTSGTFASITDSTGVTYP